MALKGAGDFQKNFIGMVDSMLAIGRPNGLAVKRTTTRGSGPGTRRRRDVRALVFTDSVLDYLVHLHLLPGPKGGADANLVSFLDFLREDYGFHVDTAPPGRVHVRKVRGFVPGYRTRLDRPTVCQWMDCQHEDPIMPDEQIAALERQHAHLRSQFASIGEMRSGSLTERFRPCGKPRCHCAKPGDPGHGPVLSLTRKQAGKTVTRIIPAHAGSETQARLAEYRRFRQLSKMFIEVNDALSEARLATGSAAKKNRRPR